MSLTRTKPAGWALNEKLTSAQMNGVDIMITNAVDKRSGQSDTVQSNLTFNTGGVVLAGTTTISGALSATAVNQCKMTAGNNVTFPSRSITRVLDSPTLIYSSASYVPGSNAGSLSAQTSAAPVSCLFHVPNGATITEIAVLIDPPAHGGSFSITAPTLGLYQVTASGVVQIGSNYLDNIAVQANYEAAHWFASSAISQTVDRTAERYAIYFTSEGGTNWLANTLVHAFRVKYNTAAYEED